jgi:molybdenum cofactor guanylyltransferase
VLGGDLPFLSPEAVALLRIAATTTAGAVFVDRDGRRQLLCGAWQVVALRERLTAVGDPYGMSMRHLVEGLPVTEVTWPAVAAPPWYDCDTDADLRRARELTT